MMLRRLPNPLQGTQAIHGIGVELRGWRKVLMVRLRYACHLPLLRVRFKRSRFIQDGEVWVERQLYFQTRLLSRAFSPEEQRQRVERFHRQYEEINREMGSP